MKLGIMQPYFFPYIGYFSLMESVDQWIFFDTVQYTKKGWMNRNRVLKRDGAWKYITIPVKKHPRSIQIKDVRIDVGDAWKERIINQLTEYRGIAPYYEEVNEFVRDSLQFETDNLARMNAHLIQKTFEYLDVKYEYRFFSELGMELDNVSEPDDWALEISKNLGADEYINSPGGRGFFHKEKFAKAGVQLKFIQPHLKSFNQNGHGSIAGLSVLDVMMFNSKQETRALIEDYEVVPA